MKLSTLALIIFLIFFSTVSADEGPSLMDSEIPLMEGATIISEKQFMGSSGQVELETTALPEEVTRFYNTVMQQKGWPEGKIMSGQGVSILTIKNQGDQFTLAATPKNGKTKVTLALVRKIKLPTAQSQNAVVKKMAGNTPAKSPFKALNHNPVNFPVNLPVADHRLEMTAPTINTDNTLDLDQPLVISFSQPMDPVFFDFEISPDKDNWTAQWSPEFDQVTLVPKVSPEPDQAVNLTASVLGGPEIQKNITYRRLPPQRQLNYDLQNNHIDINQASRYRILSLFDPSKVPEAYRLTRALPSGTPLLDTVRKDFSRLDEKTRAELLPFFLSPLDPESYYHSKLLKKNVQHSTRRMFTLVPEAWADEVTLNNLYSYITENGTHIDIFCKPDQGATASLVHDLLKSKRIYERFKQLMRVDVPCPQNSIMVALVDDIGKLYGEEHNGCYGIFYQNMKTGEPTIILSSITFAQENLLGSTLAHEMFHAFQSAFSSLDKVDTWIEESTAVWAQDYIDKTWNNEQGYIISAFEPNRKLMQQLNTNTELVPYAMYLFPYYMTKVSPKDPAAIRRIWENCASGSCIGDGAITAVDNALGGKFGDTWKKFTLATLDVAPEDKRIPDTIGRYGGMAPLKIKSSHGFKEIALSREGLGGSVAVIQGINACYFHVTNDNSGPTAPAVRFDLGSFKNDSDKIYVQSVITFLDGHKVYEDWTGKDERVFCLNIDSQCFKEIHTVISCSDSKKKKYKSFRISSVPMSRCYSGRMVISRKFEERETYESTRNITTHTTETQSSSSSGNRWATLSLGLDLEVKIHDQQRSAMNKMEEHTKNVDTYEVKEVRNTLENMMKTSRASLDSETGLMKIRYRVKDCSIGSGGGIYRSRSQVERSDAQGISNQQETNYTKQWAPVGLDEKTLTHIDQGHIRADIYFEPKTGKIMWVKVPRLDIDMQVTEQSNGQTVRRTKDGYETVPRSYNDTKEEEFQLTFSSDSRDKKDMPMDPVWQAKESTDLWATGEGRIEKPVNKEKSEEGKTSSTHGMAVETFEWFINLSSIP